MAITETQILDALRAVRLPQGGDLVGAGMVSGLTLREGHIGFAIEVDPTQATVMEPVRKAAEKAIMALPGVLTATVVLTAHRAAPQTAQRTSGPARPQPHRRCPDHRGSSTDARCRARRTTPRTLGRAYPPRR